jgi:S1-C subfamily serine protease
VITSIDNQPVVEMNDLIAYLARSTQVNQNVTLGVLRDGKQQTLDVTLAARPVVEDRTAQSSPSTTNGIRLGILGTDMNASIAKEMNLSQDQQGVLVEQVQPGSLADTMGLRAGTKTVTLNGQQIIVGGDVITMVNGKSIATIDELKSELAGLPTDHPLSLTVLRDGKEIEMQVQTSQ